MKRAVLSVLILLFILITSCSKSSKTSQEETDNDNSISEQENKDTPDSVNIDSSADSDIQNSTKTDKDSLNQIFNDNELTDSLDADLTDKETSDIDSVYTGPSFAADEIEIDENGIIYLFSKENKKIFRWDSNTKEYLDSFSVGDIDGVSGIPDKMIYSSSHQRLYFNYPYSLITYIDTTTGTEKSESQKNWFIQEYLFIKDNLVMVLRNIDQFAGVCLISFFLFLNNSV